MSWVALPHSFMASSAAEEPLRLPFKTETEAREEAVAAAVPALIATSGEEKRACKFMPADEASFTSRAHTRTHRAIWRERRSFTSSM